MLVLDETGRSKSPIYDTAERGLVFVLDANGSIKQSDPNLGTIATQNADAVDIDGGTLDGVSIGGTTPGAASLTTLTASGDVNVDNGVLVVDTTASRVGVNEGSPAVALHVNSELQIGDGAGAATAFWNGAAGTARAFFARTNGSNRFLFTMANSTAESGSNAGSDFGIDRYDDAGVYSGTPFLVKRSNGRIGINGVFAPGYTLDVGGSVHASSHPTSSDSRFKSDVQTVTGVLTKVAQMRAVTFRWNWLYREALSYDIDDTDQLGVIAQEVETHFPQAVSNWDAPDAGIVNARAVDYGRLAAAVAIGGLNEVIEQLNIINTQLDTIEARLDALEGA